LAENAGVRLLLTLGRALLARRQAPDAAVACRFRVMPWDVGIATFKSDRYFTVADAAQFDFAIRTGLLRPLLGEGVRWINLAQACRFQRPLRLFQSYAVLTRVVCVDARHAYLSHRFESAGQVHAEVLVKLKFKSGRLTVPPQRFFPQAPTVRGPAIDALDALNVLS
jgi:acyl-CoA thioesterase FadM